MKDVHGKAYGDITYRARSITKASKTVIAAEMVYYALNRISFFASYSKDTSASARA